MISGADTIGGGAGSGGAGPAAGESAIDLVARALPQDAGRLNRMLVSSVGSELSRSDVSVLSAVSESPRRITELAAAEGLAQPTVTQLVNRLERTGMLERRPDPADGRAVLVATTAEGERALERFRTGYRSWLRRRLASLPQSRVDELAAATEALGALVEVLQEDRGR